jgi:hypothetical protein
MFMRVSVRSTGWTSTEVAPRISKPKNDSHFLGVILLGQAGEDIWAGKIPAIDDRGNTDF